MHYFCLPLVFCITFVLLLCITSVFRLSSVLLLSSSIHSVSPCKPSLTWCSPDVFDWNFHQLWLAWGCSMSVHSGNQTQLSPLHLIVPLSIYSFLFMVLHNCKFTCHIFEIWGTLGDRNADTHNPMHIFLWQNYVAKRRDSVAILEVEVWIVTLVGFKHTHIVSKFIIKFKLPRRRRDF